jgi:hypothetical protein
MTFVALGSMQQVATTAANAEEHALSLVKEDFL